MHCAREPMDSRHQAREQRVQASCSPLTMKETTTSSLGEARAPQDGQNQFGHLELRRDELVRLAFDQHAQQPALARQEPQIGSETPSPPPSTARQQRSTDTELAGGSSGALPFSVSA